MVEAMQVHYLFKLLSTLFRPNESTDEVCI